MSLSRPSPPTAERRALSSSLALEDPECQPPGGKRLRLEAPGWRLPSVRRLSEAERAWAWPSRLPEPLLLSAAPARQSGAGASEERTAGRAPRSRRGSGTFPRDGRAPPPPSLGLGSGARASGRSGPGVRGAHPEGGGGAATGAGGPRRPGHPGSEGAFPRQTASALPGARGRREVHGVARPRAEEDDVSSSAPKIPTSGSQRRLEVAKPCYFRDSITISIPEFPTDLNSSMSFVYLKKITKRKNDKFEAYGRDFANIYWSQNRHNVKKQKLQDDKKIVDSEIFSPEYCESNHQLLSNQNTFERKKDLSSLNCYDHSRIKCYERDSKKTFTITLRNTNWKGAETNLTSYVPTGLEKSQSRHCNLRHILNRHSSWVMKSYKSNSEHMKRAREKLNLLQLQEIGLLGREDYRNTKAVNVHDGQQSNPLMVEMPGNQNFLINIVWLNSKGENYNMLQFRYYTIQKDFHLSNIFQSFITEVFYFCKCISGNHKDKSTLSWYQILNYENQIGIQNVIIRSINVNIKCGILSKYLQTTVSEHLNIILKTGISYLFNNFYSLARIENDSELDGYIFKWIMHMNYLKLITVEGHTVYLMRDLTFSKLLEDIVKPMLKKRKPIFKTQILKGSKKENFGSFNTTTRNLCFPIFETYEKIFFLMDFDDMEALPLIKESHDKNMSCLEQHMNVETWAHCSFSIVKTHMKSGPQFTQKSRGHISGKYNEINMHYQDLEPERKQDPKKVSSFTSKHTFEGSFNAKRQAILANQNTTHSLQINSMTINQVLNFENLQSELEGIKNDFVFKKEVKVIGQSSKYSGQVCMKVEKEEDSFFPRDGMLSVQSTSLMSKKVNVEETKSVNQNNTTDKNEYKRITRESELANSEPFHPKNVTTLYVNHQFETDPNEGNNECFQNLTEKCLSTETMTIVKDFEMKSKFDLVLEELHMFHEISKENEIPTTVQTNNGQQNYFEESNDAKEAKMEIEKDVKMVTADRKCASPMPCGTIAGPNIHRRVQSLFKWKTVLNSGEQEVPNVYCCPRTSEEEILYFTSEQDGKNTLPERPAIFPDDCMEEKLNYLPRGDSHFSHGISRIQPLKTCNRPIRIGLSRKARFKQLHPYLK